MVRTAFSDASSAQSVPFLSLLEQRILGPNADGQWRKRNGISAHFQPIFEVDSDGCLKVKGFECLSRKDEEGATHLVDGEPEYVIKNDNLMLRDTITLLKWAERQNKFVSNGGFVSVNVGQAFLNQSEAEVKKTIRAIKKSGLRPKAFKMEVVEEKFEDNDRAIANIKLLTDEDFELAIDDYGTGESTFARLQMFKKAGIPINTIKIDGKVVTGLKGYPSLDTVLNELKGFEFDALVFEWIEKDQIDETLAKVHEVLGNNIKVAFQSRSLASEMTLDKALNYLQFQAQIANGGHAWGFEPYAHSTNWQPAAA